MNYYFCRIPSTKRRRKLCLIFKNRREGQPKWDLKLMLQFWMSYGNLLQVRFFLSPFFNIMWVIWLIWSVTNDAISVLCVHNVPTFPCILGKRYSIDDARIKKFTNMINVNFDMIQGPPAILSGFPWLLKILPSRVIGKVFAVDKLTENRTVLFNYIMVKSLNSRRLKY